MSVVCGLLVRALSQVSVKATRCRLRDWSVTAHPAECALSRTDLHSIGRWVALRPGAKGYRLALVAVIIHQRYGECEVGHTRDVRAKANEDR